MYSTYLKKHAFRSPYFSNAPHFSLGLVVVIPAFYEQSLIPTLESLNNSLTPQKAVEVIVVFNASEQDSLQVTQENKNACVALKKWFNQLEKPWFNLLVIEENNLPQKHAGVGLARKIGMDEAVRRFEAINTDGTIVCFDADSKCEPNYLREIEKHFKAKELTEACSIYFEHPLGGNEYSNAVYEGIGFYELHLRYYKNGLAYAGLPFAFHTIGSSMAVRATAYCKEGGMNKRKAGEDFYFLQKFISNGTLSELNTTCVIPSPRSSDRVPFGTGRAIKEMQEGVRDIELSYAFETFGVLKQCFDSVEKWYKEPPIINHYLIEFVGRDVFEAKLQEIRTQSSDRERFVKRFFQWFNAFQTLKFVHFLRDNYFPLKHLKSEAKLLLEEVLDSPKKKLDLHLLLNYFRKLDQA